MLSFSNINKSRKSFILFYLLLLLLSTAILTACSGRPNTFPSEEFFNEKGSIALVWASNSETGEFHREGAQGLLDQAINNIVGNDFLEEIKSVNLAPLVDKGYLKKYADTFSKNGFNANLVKLPLNKSNFRESPEKGSQYYKWDFRSFKKDKGINYVLYLDVTRFGIQQDYYGFIATSAPYGISKIDIFLIDTSDNSIAGEYHTSVENKEVKDWNKPPKYSELMEAAVDSLARAFNEAWFGFF